MQTMQIGFFHPYLMLYACVQTFDVTDFFEIWRQLRLCLVPKIEEKFRESK